MANEATSAGTTPMTDAEREEPASQLVDRFSLWSGAAGLIPVPLLDMVAVGGVQLQMLRRLSEIYGVPFTDNRGKSIIASLAGAIIPASTATTTAMTFGSLIKGVPGIGTAVGALTMPVFSAGATYVIGKVFMKHFASGGTLLDFNPPDYREFIKAQQAKFRRKSASPIRLRPERSELGQRQRAPDRYGHSLCPCVGRRRSEPGQPCRGRRCVMVLPLAVLAAYLLFSVLVGLCGSQRRMGFTGTFLLSLVVTPVIALLVLLITGPSRRAEMARRAELARQTALLRRARSS